MATLFTDPYAGANGAAWNTSYWAAASSNTTAGNAKADQNGSGKGRMITTNGSYYVLERAVSTDSLLTDFLVTVTKDVEARPYYITIGINSTAEPTYSASPATNGLTSLTNGAYVQIDGNAANTSGAVVLFYKNTSGSLSSAQVVPVSWAASASYKVRIKQTATQILVTVWPAANAEPGTPSLAVTPAVMPAAGKPYIAVSNPSSGAGMGAINGVLFDDATMVSNDATAITVAPPAATATALVRVPVIRRPKLIGVSAATATAVAVTPTVVARRIHTVVVTPATSSAASVAPVVSDVFIDQTIFSAGTAGWASATAVDDDTAIEETGGQHLAFAPGSSTATWLEPQTFTDFETVVKVRNPIRVGMRGTNYVTFNQNSIYVGSSGTPATSAVNTNNGNPVWLRLRVNGTSVKAKMWYVGNAEPAGWELDTTTSTSGSGNYTLTNPDGGVASAVGFVSLATGGYSAALPATNVVLTVTVAQATETAPAVSVRGNTKVSIVRATASAVSLTPAISTQKFKTVNVTPGIATAQAKEPRLPNVAVSVTGASASATASNPAILIPVHARMTVAAATAAAQAKPATFSNVTIRTVSVTPAVASGRAVGWYNATTDPYQAIIQRDLSALATDEDWTSWFRFDETGGSTLYNHANDLGRTHTYRNMILAGTPEFGVVGPSLRKAIGFNGDDTAAYLEDTPGFNPWQTWELNHARSWEIAFRTSDANAGVLTSGEANPPIGNIHIHGVEVSNGRLVVLTEGGAWTSFKSIADGQWHHVVVVIGGKYGVEMFIDGKSELRRSAGSGAAPIEHIGYSNYVAGTFHGDLMTVVDYPRPLTGYQAQEHFYAFREATYMQAGASNALAEAMPVKARGNKKRALGLYYSGNGFPWSGIDLQRHGVFGTSVDESPFAWNEYVVFPKSVQYDVYAHNEYLNTYDLSPRWIDLTSDIDVSEYDLVFFIDLPPRQGSSVDTMQYGLMFETMVANLRDAQDEHGFALWVSQPELAAALGVVNDVQSMPIQREPYDRHAYELDNHAGDLRNYIDNDYLDAFRIVNQVDGLTDLGGYLVTDVIAYLNADRIMDNNHQWIAYNLEERPAGLNIGDELRFEVSTAMMAGPELAGAYASWYASYPRLSVIGAPINRGVVGTVVATGVGHYDNGGQDVLSPVADWALAIAVESGTTLQGRPTNGRIFVNFMDYYSTPMATIEDVNKAGSPFDFDTRRQQTVITGLYQIDYSKTQNGIPFTLPTESVLSDPATVERPIYGMTYRGLHWLSQPREELPAGAVRVHVPHASAVGEARPVTSAVTRATTIRVPAAAAFGQARVAGETEALVHVFAAEATAAASAARRPRPMPVAAATVTTPDVTVITTGESAIFVLTRFEPTFVLEAT